MPFKNGAKAVLWKFAEEKPEVVRYFDNYAEIKVSTAKKTAHGFMYDFNAIVRCFGTAFEKLQGASLKEKDVILLVDVECNTNYVKISKKNYINFICRDLEILKLKENENPEISREAKTAKIPLGSLPF